MTSFIGLPLALLATIGDSMRALAEPLDRMGKRVAEGLLRFTGRGGSSSEGGD